MSEEDRFAELISRAGHELRSPLTSIKGFSSTLVKRWDRFTDEQRLQFVATINADSERMSRIVSEVLDLARIEAGRLELQLTSVDLAGAATDVLERLGDRADVGRVEVAIPAGLSAWTDRERFERGLENLVENALKFADSGPVRLAASADGRSVAVTVADRGPGIDSERLPHIFSGPGPRGQGAPTGSGLGLVLMHRLLRAQGGSITVESEPGAGARFTVTLPMEDPGNG